MTDKSREQRLEEAFESWWIRAGRHIDPDTEDVPWFDKRKALAGTAFRAAMAQSGNYICDDAVLPGEVVFANGRKVSIQERTDGVSGYTLGIGFAAPADAHRCQRCGWPIVPEGETGCWESNCSMRPMPPAIEQQVEQARIAAIKGLFCEKHKDVGEAAASGCAGLDYDCPTCEIQQARIAALEEAARHAPHLNLDNEPDRGYWISCSCSWNADGTINGNEDADWAAHVRAFALAGERKP